MPKTLIETLEAKQGRIESYCENVLGKKFTIPVEIDKEAARAIAVAILYGKEGGFVWQNGNQRKLSSVKLRISLQ